MTVNKTKDNYEYLMEFLDIIGQPPYVKMLIDIGIKKPEDLAFFTPNVLLEKIEEHVLKSERYPMLQSKQEEQKGIISEKQ